MDEPSAQPAGLERERPWDRIGPRMSRRMEGVLLALILIVGASLRFAKLDLVEFKGDEATAAELALGFIKGGALPRAGLMSSVGVTNPPLFIYLLIPAFFVTTDISAVTCFVGLGGLAAVAATWWMGRRYYGQVAGLVAAGLFAVSPWAVIYSRKLWAQDFVPLLAVGACWAVHALCFARKPRAIFWAVLLPLWITQIHFSGLALTATVVVALVLFRPPIEWKWVGAALVAALIPLLPYLSLQTERGGADFRKAWTTVGGQELKVPPGMIVHPDSGYVLRTRAPWAHAMAIVDGDRIEDILGLSTRRALDPRGVWRQSYFEDTLTLGNWLPLTQLALVFAAVAWLIVHGRRHSAERGRWILLVWMIVPVTVFLVARLGTYVSYFVILYPANFLLFGLAAEHLWTRYRWVVLLPVGLLVAGNVMFVTDLFRFVEQNRGAHGTYGTVLADKQRAAQFLAGLADPKQLVEEGRLWQVDRLVEVGAPQPVALAEPAQLDLPFLAPAPVSAVKLPANQLVFVVDRNRANFEPAQWVQHRTMVAVPEGTRLRLHELKWNRLAPIRESDFGAISIFVIEQ